MAHPAQIKIMKISVAASVQLEAIRHLVSRSDRLRRSDFDIRKLQSFADWGRIHEEAQAELWLEALKRNEFVCSAYFELYNSIWKRQHEWFEQADNLQKELAAVLRNVEPWYLATTTVALLPKISVVLYTGMVLLERVQYDDVKEWKTEALEIIRELAALTEEYFNAAITIVSPAPEAEVQK